ncbi:MAG TPA: hypothetical protein VFO07_18325 [Roseiflexaceae bacterium]|nr:hypothetical protein [Roseiflexaceae bacterium]
MAGWHKAFLALAAACLIMLLAACPLTAYGIRTQTLIPPPVLLDLGPIWLGDVCRDIQSRVLPRSCPPAYTITLMLDRKRSYILLRIPTDGPLRSRRF